MKFNPLMFQASLSAGGIALMPFNYLQFAVPHEKGLIKLADIVWQNLSVAEIALYAPLVGIMLVFVILHVILTAIFLAGLFQWFGRKGELMGLMNNPIININIFAPIASLSMTANVFWGPVGFFVPGISSNLQWYMGPSLLFFALLWIALFSAEIKLIKVLVTRELDVKKLSFTWLLDAFAFALVNLAGTGIAASAKDTSIAAIAAFASIFSLAAGLFILFIKLFILIYLQIKADRLPDKPVIPAFFMIIPITCLFGISLYRIGVFAQQIYKIDMSVLSFFTVNFSYVFTIAWGIAALFILSDYFKNDFKSAGFSAPQWGLVCALVGSQVLGVYVNGYYFKTPILAAVNYASVIAAVIIYGIVMVKFVRSLVTQVQKI